LLREEEYHAANQALGGLHQINLLAPVANLFANIDSGEQNCEFSLQYRFVKKDFGGYEYVGLIISYSPAHGFYEVLIN
jgi:hypothetical protein